MSRASGCGLPSGCGRRAGNPATRNLSESLRFVGSGGIGVFRGLVARTRGPGAQRRATAPGGCCSYSSLYSTNSTNSTNSSESLGKRSVGFTSGPAAGLTGATVHLTRRRSPHPADGSAKGEQRHARLHRARAPSRHDWASAQNTGPRIRERGADSHG
ncbi:MAG: hypothetical protein ACK52I_22805 [Pseudomonadota bacterium]